jgi:hypothetical protein
MVTVSIVLNKTQVVKSVEVLLWKYGGAIENNENYKLVYNTKSDSDNNAIDSRLLMDSLQERAHEVCDIMRDYGSEYDDHTIPGTIAIAAEMSDRWTGAAATSGGNNTTLNDLVMRYVTDGMMADYLNVTAPTEAAVYANRLQSDEQKLKDNIYSLNPPV